MLLERELMENEKWLIKMAEWPRDTSCGILMSLRTIFWWGIRVWMQPCNSGEKTSDPRRAQILDIGENQPDFRKKSLCRSKEEIDRVVQWQANRKESDILISVDTWKSQVRRAALEAGAILSLMLVFLGHPKIWLLSSRAWSERSYAYPVMVRPYHPSSTILPRFAFGNQSFSEQDFQQMAQEPIQDLDVDLAWPLGYDSESRAADVQTDRIMLILDRFADQARELLLYYKNSGRFTEAVRKTNQDSLCLNITVWWI